MINDKKAGVISSVFMWIFATFFYFVIGYDLVKSIVFEVFLTQNPTGLMFYFGAVVPFIPVLGLMYWGYTILNPEPVASEGSF